MLRLVALPATDAEQKLDVMYRMALAGEMHSFIQSLGGQFIIGGLTVAGIAGFSNRLHNPALAGVIASVPIGMPSSIFVEDADVVEYSWNLLAMTSVLFLATFVNWFLIARMKMSKYESVACAMSVWAGLGAVYYLLGRAIKKTK